jgi:hypothetical protein
VYRRGNVVAVTVQRYPKTSRAELVGIYRKAHATRVTLSGLGDGAVLYDVLARPGNYQEVVLFSGGDYVIAARTPLVVQAKAPAAPPAKLLTLLRGMRARL